MSLITPRVRTYRHPDGIHTVRLPTGEPVVLALRSVDDLVYM